MSDINRVIVSGRLTRDPEARQTQSGSTVTRWSMAVNDRVKNQQSGQWEDRPNFVDCTVFDSRAESLAGMLAKGMQVCVEGRLRWSSWEKDGQRRSKIEVVVDEVVLPPRRSDGVTGAPQTSAELQEYVNRTFAQGQQQPATEPYQDEIPFDGGHAHE